MDKRIILSVAGSGKTYYLVSQLNLVRRTLLITYTIGNSENLKAAIISKFGFIPENIKIKTYFNFLYSFCFKPFLANGFIKGVYWDQPPEFTRFLKRSDLNFYVYKKKWLYHNRIALLILQKKISNEVKFRLEKYYDCLFIDEVQDFGGYDFDLLSDLAQCNLQILFVGDFFQHTYNTSQDGNINCNLYKDLSAYYKKFEAINFLVDLTTLINSRRCSATICDFIRNEVGIQIFSENLRTTEIKVIGTQEEADLMFFDDEIIKLFYSGQDLYNCNSHNWGSSKGLEFDNICVVLNKETLRLFNGQNLSQLKSITKNKFYVACSRGRNNLYFVSSKFYDKFNVKNFDASEKQ